MHKVAFAWCGADGSLLKPISQYLWRNPKVCQRLRGLVRQEHGLSAADTVRVLRSTDSYGKHRQKLAQFYVKHFQPLPITSVHATPTANADGARLPGDFQSTVAAMVTVTADPQHDLFALRRVTRTVGSIT